MPLAQCIFVSSGSGSFVINKQLNDGSWHELEWSRQYKHVKLVLDETTSGETDLPGNEMVLNVADQVHVGIGGFPNSSHSVNGES